MSPVPTSDNSSNPMGAPPGSDPMQARPPPSSTSELPTAALELAAKLFEMARTGDEQLIQYLEAGAPPNLTNNRGDTILMLACYHGHTALVQRMLALPTPPDTNQLNGRGQSILAGVVFKGHNELIPTLVQAGADPLAGQPSAEESAKMFNRWEGDENAETRRLFETAPGRGRGARDAAPAVEDREEARRVPGSGPTVPPGGDGPSGGPTLPIGPPGQP